MFNKSVIVLVAVSKNGKCSSLILECKPTDSIADSILLSQPMLDAIQHVNGNVVFQQDSVLAHIAFDTRQLP